MTESEAARSLLGKVGVTFNERRTAVYTTAGYTWASLRRTYSSGPTFTVVDTKWIGGWTAGVGIEHLLISHLSLMAEYRFNQYKNNIFDIYENPPLSFYTNNSYDEHEFRAGMTLRF